MGAPSWLPFEEVEHSADLALRVRGADLAQLFVHAAQGMFYLMHCVQRGDSQPTIHHIALEAPDSESLLVDWLNELLYLAERKQEHLLEYEIKALAPTSIVATVHGMTHHPRQKVIKAATFWDLRIVQHDAYCEATITFDV